MRSTLKIAVYLGTILVLLMLVARFPQWPVGVAAALLLGLAYAHGLELQHEALHAILLPTPRGNRLVGALLGLPMLTTYTDTRLRHLHHHRFVGTTRDIYDRSCRDFASSGAVIAHVLSAGRLRDFITTLGALAANRADPILKGRAYALARNEFVITAIVMAALLAFAAAIDLRLVLWGWLVPALLVAPVIHFLMTSPEHVGRERASRDPARNSRTYPASPLWNYLINYDNYHIEHHLRPTLPFWQLPALHAARCRAGAPSCPNYVQAMREVFRGIGACLQSRG
ncbi:MULTISPECIES: fatty acid desaturase [Rhodopseudomonas]|uniref:fatty acid desaturase family protein n=1 Tax=Rhodopseudomonas TaxID=1073 RepID=UPI001364D0F6|nr:MULTISPECIES: fatty acid desaturase [Rhodopseudomonas]MDF3808921.1 fatty acid desaturase [Rhodopseudomonas sp. BAL398]WOK18370.1 fatty acid desaturase [Rhodopseudomonas sp. BAL398]